MRTDRIGIAFDFDGTLVDTELAEFEAWCQVNEKFPTTWLIHEVETAIRVGPHHDPVSLSKRVAEENSVPDFLVYHSYRSALYNHPSLKSCRTRL